jgi:subtilisin family serine protease
VDPALRELVDGGGPADEVEAILRLGDSAVVPAGVRPVTRFGPVVTCRLARGAIAAVHSDPAVISMKASRTLRPAEDIPIPYAGVRHLDRRRPPGIGVTGRGVVVGVVDWGCDFAHPNLRTSDGRTRLVALWDQRDQPGGAGVRPYGYGVVHNAAAVDAALTSRDPYAALGYHPADADPGDGAHGTACLDIAAGSGAVGPAGLAPAAELVFVHMARSGFDGLANLGDSVRILEAVDFVFRVAGPRPCVVNLSMGGQAGSHDGTSLVEQGLDHAARSAPGRVLCQSAGNYFTARGHAYRRLRTGERWSLGWQIPPADPTTNELELWYPAGDALTVELRWPGGGLAGAAAAGETRPLVYGGREVGRLYHRDREPNSAKGHVDVFLYPPAPAGEYTVDVVAGDVDDGRCHAWIERDSSRADSQSRFRAAQADPATTVNTICNGRLTISVGAVDGHAASTPLAPFSSAGPTAAGLRKPDLVAPGVSVLCARSSPRDGSGPVLARKTGTSFAAPHVTGTVALMLAAADRPLAAEEVRRRLLAALRPLPATTRTAADRLGYGLLDPTAAVAAVTSAPREEPMIDFDTGTDADPAGFSVVCAPGQNGSAPDVRPGDYLWRSAPGSRYGGYAAMITSPRLVPSDELPGAGVDVERSGPGWFVYVSEPDTTMPGRFRTVARRVRDHRGIVPAGTMVLRPFDSDSADEPATEGVALRRAGAHNQHVFDRRQELVDKMNAQSAAMHYRLAAPTSGAADEEALEYVEVDPANLNPFDRKMKALIDLGQKLPMRLVDHAGLLTGGNPVNVDALQSAYVDIDDVLNTDDISFQLILTHFLTERSHVGNYDRRIGTPMPGVWAKTHPLAREAEADLLRELVGDLTIYFYGEEWNGSTWVAGWKSAEKYRIHRLSKETKTSGMRRNDTVVDMPDGRRITVAALIAERAAAGLPGAKSLPPPGPAPVPSSMPASGPASGPASAPGEGVAVWRAGRQNQHVFDRRQELVDRMNKQSPAMQYTLGADGQTIAYNVLDPSGLSPFDVKMRELIDLPQVLPMRLVDSAGLSFGQHVDFDGFVTGYVDMEDLLAAEDLAFQLLMIHLLVERAQVRGYARRIGTAIGPLYDRAHAIATEAEAEHLRNVIGDRTIMFRWEEEKPDGQVVFAFRSAERYFVYEFISRPRAVRGMRMVVETADKRRITVAELMAERAAAGLPGPASAPASTPASAPASGPASIPVP